MMTHEDLHVAHKHAELCQSSVQNFCNVAKAIRMTEEVLLEAHKHAELRLSGVQIERCT